MSQENTQPEVTVVVVSFNTRDLVLKCLESFQRFETGPSHEIIVVDNASSDGTAQAVEKNFPQVRIIRNMQNTGFARGANQGAAAGAGKWVLFFNPDAYLKESLLGPLLRCAESDFRIAAVGSRVEFPDGRHQPTAGVFPGLLLDFSDLFLGPVNFLPRFMRPNCILNRDFPKVRQVDWLSGSCLMVKREIFEKDGGFDEQFFLGEEDIDLGFRLKKDGWKVMYCPDAVMVHAGGQSRRKNSRSFFYLLQGRYPFYKKNRGVLYSGLYRARARFSIGMKMALSPIKDPKERFRGMPEEI